MKILLASTSPFRRALLERLQLPFTCVPPEVDESPQAQEAPYALVRRLAHAKASIVAQRYPDCLVIGSDQVASLDGEAMGKPGDHAHAVSQLSRLSGRRVIFYTGLCVITAPADSRQDYTDVTHVQFRHLGATEIEHYLHAEQPYQCAGSFKSEGLGISLFERIESDDPTALIGLPLIALCGMLRESGVPLP